MVRRMGVVGVVGGVAGVRGLDLLMLDGKTGGEGGGRLEGLGVWEVKVGMRVRRVGLRMRWAHGRARNQALGGLGGGGVGV